MQRRELLWRGAAAGIAMVSGRAFAQTSGEKLIAWTDQPPPIPPPAHDVIHNLTGWESLDTWITPNDKFFSIAHYNRPTIDAAAWRLNLSGLVRPTALTLDPIEGSTTPRRHVHLELLRQ